MTDYVHLRDLDDPEKPWRRVWRCPTGVYVKTHAKRRDPAFGVQMWEITGSACDETGKALPWSNGYAILNADRPHQFQVLSENTAPDQEPISARLDRELRFVVARVERAELNAREAAAI